MTKACETPGAGEALEHGRIYAFAGLVLIGATLLNPTPSRGLTKTCLTGKDPAVANDAAQIQAVRVAIANSCDCANYDGSAKGKMHGDYVKCAKAVVTSQVDLGNLRSQCKGTVNKFYSQSTCGLKSTLNSVPCVKRVTSSGKVSCAIKSGSACVSKAGSYDQVSCAPKATCIDSADTNGDQIIGTGPGGTDTGGCSCPFGLADCNGDASDGCEAQVFADESNCGTCGHACEAPSGGTPVCVFGTCTGDCPANETLCIANANGGGVCASGECPRLTPQFGTAGGVAHVDGCPPNELLNGFTVNLQSGHIAQIYPICGKFYYQADKKGIGPDVTLPGRGSVDPAQPNNIQTVSCPAADPSQIFGGHPGYALVGFQAFSDGTHITGLKIRCAPVTVAYKFTLNPGNSSEGQLLILATTIGTPFDSALLGTTGTTASAVTDCLAGWGATATNLTADGGLNAIGLGCTGAPHGQTFPFSIIFGCL